MLPDESIEKFYYKDQRMMLMIVIMGIGLVPMGIDGFTQLLTSYESTNTMRIITGVPAGFVGGWLFSAMFSACLLYTSPSPRDQRGSRMPSSA